jgi:hypothetical protein
MDLTLFEIVIPLLRGILKPAQLVHDFESQLPLTP